MIVITYNKCTFSANDRVRKAWTRERDTFLWPKGQEQRIMGLEFILPFGRLNLTSLPPKKRQKVLEQTELSHTKVVEILSVQEK